MQDTSHDNQDPRAARSREALHSALLSLLEEKSLDQITIRDIVAEAGIGYTAFFRDHPNKESLQEDIAARQISTLLQLSVPEMEAKNLRAGSIALLNYVEHIAEIMDCTLVGPVIAATSRKR